MSPPGNREPEIQETLQSEHFQLCKVNGARSPAKIGVVLGAPRALSPSARVRTPIILSTANKGLAPTAHVCLVGYFGD